MSKENFYTNLKNSSRPVVVDFWAPWCGPCRAIGPVIEKLGHDYAGRVDVWKINADSEPDIMRAFRIFGIPTVIAFRDGQEVMRHTGSAPAQVLQPLFEAALSGNKPARSQLTAVQRLLRLGAGLALIIVALIAGLHGFTWLIAGLGAIVMFTAVYDRCPVYRAVSMQIRENFQKKPAAILEKDRQEID